MIAWAGAWLIPVRRPFWCAVPKQAALAGAASWEEYGKLFVESRFVHVTSVDFLALCLFAPFWMWNDAEKRDWEGRHAPSLCQPASGLLGLRVSMTKLSL